MVGWFRVTVILWIAQSAAPNARIMALIPVDDGFLTEKSETAAHLGHRLRVRFLSEAFWRPPIASHPCAARDRLNTPRSGASARQRRSCRSQRQLLRVPELERGKLENWKARWLLGGAAFFEFSSFQLSLVRPGFLCCSRWPRLSCDEAAQSADAVSHNPARLSSPIKLLQL